MTMFRPAMALTGLLTVLAMPASAETAAAHWDTYFYAAPRADARVLDEVQRATKLDVQDCEAGWCRVRYGEVNGFVREEIVHGPANDVRPSRPPSEAACVSAAQPGGGTWQSERFCRPGP